MCSQTPFAGEKAQNAIMPVSASPEFTPVSIIDAANV
jgi:hypothetical protein